MTFDRAQRIAEHRAELRAREEIRRQNGLRIRELRQILKVIYGEGVNG